MPLFGCAFFTVLFLQSGLDKVFDRKGNLSWLVPHFEKSPLKGQVPHLLSFITLMELATGILSLVGALDSLFEFGLGMATVALCLAALTLVILFAGQRIAKDYAGAASLAAYFAVALIAIFASN